MTQTASRAAPPASILLATDLSARCDRALDRAVQLAGQWGARLVVATVVPAEQDQELFEDMLGSPSWQQRLSPQRLAERRLLRDLGELAAPPPLKLRVEHGHVGRTLLQVAHEEGCGLIVTGLASDKAFEPQVLGSTVSWLAQHSPLPLLVVHGRARAPYRNLAVASDFSEPSQLALDTALALFGPPLRLALVHGLEVPRLGLLTGDRAAVETQARDEARAQARAMVDGAGLSPELATQAALIVEPGEPARILRDYVRDHDIELVAVGTHGRGALFDLVLGSVAKRLLAVLETDTLLVRDPRARGGGAAS